MPSTAYQNDPAIKRKFLRRVREDAKHDRLRQRFGYWEEDWDGEFRGCSVGCAMRSNEPHVAFADLLGGKHLLQLAYLDDKLFENLPAKRAIRWPADIFAAIKVGADLSLVWPKFAIALLSDEKHGTRQHCFEQGKVATDMVVALYQRLVDGGAVTKAKWRSAREAAAWAAEEAEAAWAAWAAAARAARAAAEAEEAEEAEAEWAAWAAEAAAAAAAAARTKHFVWQADTLLRLLKEAT